ncbi:MAG: SpaH/EbpB family LPXTG-anchored major pilin [Oenococcus sp.]|uniref:SpaH/EbpB family LPXTG-anchored major pilin n=1 Tax=Oenococcus TaxID=46254 RepID=UPI0021E7B03A|nr:SpaH/EbpB family LPXTG-anchored major pilin [Oenococcus kitaharae]MCV3296597.1 SpaH/EbpB family LPXTG-anchored major pilin [Oenococcus kitaharae]
MKNKLWTFIAGLILLLPLTLSSFVASTQAFAADTSTVNVTLHKRVFDEGQLPADKQNTGEVTTDFGGMPLAGVTFTAYDVTDQYLTFRGSGDTAQQAIAKIQEASTDGAPAYATMLSSGVTTAPDGTYTFMNLALKDGNKDKVYLFLETDSPTNVTAKAAPIVLAMPIYANGSDTQINTNIHVYPKNEKADPIVKDLTDQSKLDLTVTLPDGSKIFNAAYGQTFGYTIQVAVPWNIKDKDTFTVVDTPDLGIDINTASVAVAGLVKGTDYTVVANQPAGKGLGYKITFDTSSAAVRAQAGKKLMITYQAVLTNAATPDTGLNNTASLAIGNGTDLTTTDTPGPVIYTGGAKFIKEDKQSAAKLAGAEFKLVRVNASGDIVAYATQAADGSYTWNAAAAGATVYTSDAAGMLSLKGLAYSAKLAAGESYALLETKAPTGYALLTAPVKFTVTQGSYGDRNTITIVNIQKGILPATGGSGIVIFLVIGSILMASAYLWNKKRQDQTEI